MSVKDILLELKAAIPTENIETVGEIYNRLETASIGYSVTGLSKPFQMQLMRKYLMQTYTAEMMRVGTSITAHELENYDIISEIDKMIDFIGNS